MNATGVGMAEIVANCSRGAVIGDPTPRPALRPDPLSGLLSGSLIAVDSSRPLVTPSTSSEVARKMASEPLRAGGGGAAQDYANGRCCSTGSFATTSSTRSTPWR